MSPLSPSIGSASAKSLPSSTASSATSRCRRSVRQDIIERTDGIPLFVEEMTKAVLEAESEGDARSRPLLPFPPRLWRFRQACTLR